MSRVIKSLSENQYVAFGIDETCGWFYQLYSGINDDDKKSKMKFNLDERFYGFTKHDLKKKLAGHGWNREDVSNFIAEARPLRERLWYGYVRGD